jgi:hypothetical protein
VFINSLSASKKVRGDHGLAHDLPFGIGGFCIRQVNGVPAMLPNKISPYRVNSRQRRSSFLNPSQTAAENHEARTEKKQVQWFGQHGPREGARSDKIGKRPGIDQGENHQEEYQGKQYGCFLHVSRSCYDQLIPVFRFNASRAVERGNSNGGAKAGKERMRT